MGSDFTPTDECGPYDHGISFVVRGPSSYVVPQAGVVTGWTFTAGPDDVSVKLKLSTQSAQGQNFFTTVTSSDLLQVPANSSATQSVRIPVAGGEYLGFFLAPGPKQEPVCGTEDYNDPDLANGFINLDPAVGSTYDYSLYHYSRFPVSARVEPDADGDGYGDETQDSCPSDPAVHDGSCSSSSSSCRGAAGTSDRTGWCACSRASAIGGWSPAS